MGGNAATLFFFGEHEQLLRSCGMEDTKLLNAVLKRAVPETNGRLRISRKKRPTKDVNATIQGIKERGHAVLGNNTSFD